MNQTISPFHFDEGCTDTGRDWMYCPCDEVVIKRIYGVGNKGVNTIWLESTSKVLFADGTTDYMTMLATHPNDDDLRKIREGQKFKRKEPMKKPLLKAAFRSFPQDFKVQSIPFHFMAHLHQLIRTARQTITSQSQWATNQPQHRRTS